MSALATTAFITWSLALAVGLYVQLLSMLAKGNLLEKIWRAAGRAHQELWLFASPGILIGTSSHLHHKPWMLIFDALSMFNWWYFRNWPEDNHWKRRGKKARDAVKVRAGRLVVVPVGASR